MPRLRSDPPSPSALPRRPDLEAIADRIDRPPRTWRLLRTPPATGPRNMALDVALARCLGPDEAVLRIYRWSHPTLSLGRNQPARDRYRALAASQPGTHVVRRPTGGREVLHDRELTYAVVVPLRALGGPRSTYRAVNEALLEALRSLGIAARLALGEERTPGPGDGACFKKAVGDEIEAEGRKLVGSAQARIGHALLQHGSLLLAPPSRGFAGVGSAGVSISEIAGRPVTYDAVSRAVESSVMDAFPGGWSRGGLRPRERRVAASLLDHYESPGWTWRR